MFRARADQALTDAETIARVRGALQGYQASHGREALVNVAHVLDLLNPRGLWSLDPERRRQQAAEEKEKGQPQMSPTADPITGCEPVTAPGAP